jgi:hypothetical protein
VFIVDGPLYKRECGLGFKISYLLMAISKFVIVCEWNDWLLFKMYVIKIWLEIITNFEW